MKHTSNNKKQWVNNLDAWKATKSPTRLEEDTSNLSHIFSLASASPAFAEALEWAKKHNIEFIVDRTFSGAAGYYNTGTGVVAIGHTYLNNASHQARAIEILTHEIRHAWQDYHQMIPSFSQNFQTRFAQVSLIEADAAAYGALAKKQYLSSDEERSKISSNQVLWDTFKSWYSSWRRYPYGNTVSRKCGVELNIPTIKKVQYNFEYQPSSYPKTKGLDIMHQNALHKLGKNFNNGNYFPNAARDFIQKKVLPPSLAFKFYYTDNPNKALLHEIRKREITLKLHKNNKTPHKNSRTLEV